VNDSVVPQLIRIANETGQTMVRTTSMGHSDLRLFWENGSIGKLGMKEEKDRSICEFDYVILKGIDQNLIAIIGQKLLSANNTPVYTKQNNAIIKITQQEDCI
jgi:hypothetical protein